MKSFSYELSPINLKSHTKDYLFQQFLPRMQAKDTVNLNHSLETLHSGVNFMEQKIVSTAKTIVYLFSPDIDLLERLEHNIENYDKYQKTKMLLRQLFSTLNGTEIQNEVMKTTEEIEKLQWEIEQLSSAFSHLQTQNRIKDEQIMKYKNSIIDLSKAYEQAKIYFMDEILEYKYQIEELKANIQQKVKRERSRSKSKLKKVTLQLPNKSSNTEAFTDRSIYKRFSVSQVQEDSSNLKENPMAIASNYSTSRHLIQKYEFEKEQLQQRIMDLEASIKNLQEENTALKKQHEIEMRELGKKIYGLEEELREKSSKLREKNKAICDLLDSLQAKKKQGLQ